MELGQRLSRMDERGPDGAGSRLTLFLDTHHSGERDHDIAATLDAIRMLVDPRSRPPPPRARPASLPTTDRGSSTV